MHGIDYVLRLFFIICKKIEGAINDESKAKEKG